MTNNAGFISKHEQEIRANLVPESVHNSEFGCRNCLWQCVECNNGSMYKAKDNSPECASYTYYD